MQVESGKQGYGKCPPTTNIVNIFGAASLLLSLLMNELPTIVNSVQLLQLLQSRAWKLLLEPIVYVFALPFPHYLFGFSVNLC